MIGNTPLTQESLRLRGFVYCFGLELEYNITNNTRNILSAKHAIIENNEVKTWEIYVTIKRKSDYDNVWRDEGHCMITDKLSTEEEFDLLYEIITGEKIKLLKVPKPNPEIMLKFGHHLSLVNNGGYSRNEKIKYDLL